MAVVDDPELFSTKGKYGLSFLSDPPNAIVEYAAGRTFDFRLTHLHFASVLYSYMD